MSIKRSVGDENKTVGKRRKKSIQKSPQFDDSPGEGETDSSEEEEDEMDSSGGDEEDEEDDLGRQELWGEGKKKGGGKKGRGKKRGRGKKGGGKRGVKKRTA